MAQIVRIHPTTLGLLPEHPAIINLRNILVHAYSRVDYDIIWDIATFDVPKLHQVVQQLLQEAEGK